MQMASTLKWLTVIFLFSKCYSQQLEDEETRPQGSKGSYGAPPAETPSFLTAQEASYPEQQEQVAIPEYSDIGQQIQQLPQQQWSGYPQQQQARFQQSINPVPNSYSHPGGIGRPTVDVGSLGGEVDSLGGGVGSLGGGIGPDCGGAVPIAGGISCGQEIGGAIQGALPASGIGGAGGKHGNRALKRAIKQPIKHLKGIVKYQKSSAKSAKRHLYKRRGERKRCKGRRSCGSGAALPQIPQSTLPVDPCIGQQASIQGSPCGNVGGYDQGISYGVSDQGYAGLQAGLGQQIGLGGANFGQFQGAQSGFSGLQGIQTGQPSLGSFQGIQPGFQGAQELSGFQGQGAIQGGQAIGDLEGLSAENRAALDQIGGIQGLLGQQIDLNQAGGNNLGTAQQLLNAFKQAQQERQLNFQPTAQAEPSENRRRRKNRYHF